MKSGSHVSSLKESSPRNGAELSLTIKADEEFGQGVTCNTRISHESKNMKLDIQNVDILGPAEVVKKIFRLPVTNDEPYFALHRMGNTLLIDSIVGLDRQHSSSTTDPEALQNQESNVAMFSPDRPQQTSDGSIVGINALRSQSHTQQDKEAQTSDVSTDLKMDSPFLPSPGFYIPQCPAPLPFRHTLMWKLQNLRFAMGSDLVVYSTKDHPILTVAPMDTTREVELSTCVDYYLDNVMANVPELALCMHAKGFLRGISVCHTEDIPHLNTAHHSHAQADPQSTAKSSAAAAEDSTKEAALFDPKVIEFNALTILQFLKENCDRDNGTYIVHMQRGDATSSIDGSSEGNGGSIQIYDLQSISLSRQKKWKWMLAMLSQRFAMRLGHHYTEASPHSRVVIRDRQMSLFQSCYDLLSDIQRLGGGKHGTIRAAVLEQMADIRLSRAESRSRHIRLSSQYVEGSTTAKLESADDANKTPTPKKEKKKKHSGKAKNNKTRVKESSSQFITPHPLMGSESVVIDQTINGDAFGEIESIDFNAEMLESVQILQQAMSDLLDAMQGVDGENEDAVADESKTQSASSSAILIGDVACETLVSSTSEEEYCEGEVDGSMTHSKALVVPPSFTGSEDDSVDEPCTVDVTLALQYSGLLHKTMLSCIHVVRHMLETHSGHCGEAIIAEAIKILVTLVPFCSDWIKMTAKLKTKILQQKKEIERKNNIAKEARKHTYLASQDPLLTPPDTTLTLHIPSLTNSVAESSGGKLNEDDELYEETMHDFWGIDRTILTDMPLLWDVLGEICRELSCGRQSNGANMRGIRSHSSGSGDECDDEWGLWATHGKDIRRLACSFTAMVVQASRFEPMDSNSQFIFNTIAIPLETACPNKSTDSIQEKGNRFSPSMDTELGHCGSIDISFVHWICWELCGGRNNIAIDKSSSLLMTTILELFCKVAPLVLRTTKERGPTGEHGCHANSGLVEVLEIQNYAFAIAAILAARGESGWSKCHWLTTCDEQHINDEETPNSKCRSPSRHHKLPLKVHTSGSRIPSRIQEILRHLGDASNELGQEWYKNNIQNKIMMQNIPGVDAVDLLQPLYDVFSDCLLKPCQEADFLYEVALQLFQTLCEESSTTTGSDKTPDPSSITDMRNKVTVQCNMSCLRRSLSSRLSDAILTLLSDYDKTDTTEISGESYSEKMSMIATAMERIYLKGEDSSAVMASCGNSKKKTHSIKANKHSASSSSLFVESSFRSTLRLKSPLQYLEDAVIICVDDQIATSGSNYYEPLGFALQSECGFNYLAKGLLHRRCFSSDNATSHRDSAVSLHIKEVEMSLERALDTFSRIPTATAARQKALSHYHLGAFHNFMWNSSMKVLNTIADTHHSKEEMIQAQEMGDSHLEATMNHYSLAHQYFLKYDVGPTLAVILLDMCDIYLTSYDSRESALHSELSRVMTSMTFVSKDSQDTTATSSDVAASVLAIRSTVESLLGGAFRSLIDCRRFVLTSVVIDRHGQHMVENGIITRLLKSLQQLLLKMIKVLSSVCYEGYQGTSKNSAGDSTCSVKSRDETVNLLKGIYRDLLSVGLKYSDTSQFLNTDGTVSTICDAVDKLNSSEWLKAIM